MMRLLEGVLLGEFGLWFRQRGSTGLSWCLSDLCHKAHIPLNRDSLAPPWLDPGYGQSPECRSLWLGVEGLRERGMLCLLKLDFISLVVVAQIHRVSLQVDLG